MAEMRVHYNVVQVESDISTETRMKILGRFAAIVLIAFWLAPVAARGQELRSVTIRIELDGKSLLTAITGDNGQQPPEVVWRYLTKYPFLPVKGVKVEPDADNPLRLTLKGKVVVDVPYGGKAQVAELHLQRKTAKDGWRVVEHDVEVMATTIGLPPAPAPPPVAPTPSTPKEEMKPGASPAPTAPMATPTSFGGSIWVWLLGALIVIVLIAAVYKAMPREQHLG
jgi:hypothetical protein